MWIASAAWLALVLGLVWRKNRRAHVPLMLAGIIADVSLVLYLQFAREAVQTALEFKLSFLEQSHIVVSTLALVLYLPVTVLGFRLLLGEFSIAARLWHLRLAISAFVLRTLGFIFMFSMWD